MIRILIYWMGEGSSAVRMAEPGMLALLKSRRAFQIVLIGSNLVPLFTGTLVTVMGVALFVPTDVAGVDFAAQVRVYAIWFTGIFFLCVWIARNIEIAGPVLTILAILIALAGASRLYTMIELGEYPMSTYIAAFVEMAVILFIPWHRFLLGYTET
ncbi:MAG: DUF4345 family protein [Pseudomonadota bacterium]